MTATPAMPGIAVKAAGMVTPVGFNAAASCAAMWAGVRGVEELSLWDAESGEPVVSGKVFLPHWWEGIGKFADLAAPAIEECRQEALRSGWERVPILLCVAPPDRPLRPEGLDRILMAEIAARLGIDLDRESGLFSLGAAGCGTALREAARLIGEGRAQACIVAGVDSFLQQELLEVYIERRRVLTATNSNGFSPGEAGCAVLVAPPGRAPRGELQILGAGAAVEKATIESEEPLRAEGLAGAIGAALGEAGLDFSTIDYRITDLNGEHYKFKEAALALMRHHRRPKERLLELWHPIEYLGEIGAAIGPCILGWALHAGRKGYAPGPTVLVHMGSDGGDRTAIIARYVAGEEG